MDKTRIDIKQCFYFKPKLGHALVDFEELFSIPCTGHIQPHLCLQVHLKKQCKPLQERRKD